MRIADVEISHTQSGQKSFENAVIRRKSGNDKRIFNWRSSPQAPIKAEGVLTKCSVV